MLTDHDLLFSWSNTLALAGWTLLMLSPKRWRWLLITTGAVIPCILGIVYGGLMLTYLSSVEDGGYASFSQVKVLMSSDPILLAGWLHYLCFDLMIGTFIAKEADRLGIARLIQLPILFGTFYYGPAGLVLFLLVKAGWQVVDLTKNEKLFNNKEVVQ